MKLSPLAHRLLCLALPMALFFPAIAQAEDITITAGNVTVPGFQGYSTNVNPRPANKNYNLRCDHYRFSRNGDGAWCNTIKSGDKCVLTWADPPNMFQPSGHLDCKGP